MTKTRLRRLIELSVDYWVQRYRQEGVIQFDARDELMALQEEFEAWEQERSDAKGGEVLDAQNAALQRARERDEARAEVEEWKTFRAGQIDLEARNAIEYSLRCRERDEAREVACRLLPFTRGREDLLPGAVLHLMQQHAWLKEKR